MIKASSTYELREMGRSGEPMVEGEYNAHDATSLINDEDKSPRSSLSFQILKNVSRRTSLIQPILVLMLLGAVIIFQIVIIWKSIWLSGIDLDLTNVQRTFYTLGITIIATIIAVLAVEQIRRLWLAHYMRQDSGKDTAIRAQILLGIAKKRDQARLYWLVILLAACNLITATFTASTAIAVEQRSYSSNSGLFVMNEYDSESCYTTLDNPGPSDFGWRLPGQNRIIRLDARGVIEKCPQGISQRVAGLSTIFGTSEYARRQDNVCHSTWGGRVLCSALGTPLALTPDCNLFRPFNCERGITNTACTPVFTKSPISCRVGGTIQASSGGAMPTLTSKNCSSPSTYALSNDQEAVSYCPSNDTVGEMTFLLGSLVDTTYLRTLMGDPSANISSVECTLSLNSTLAFQTVTNQTITYYNRTYDAVQSTGQACDPGSSTSINAIINDYARLAAASFVIDLFGGYGSSVTNVIMDAMGYNMDSSGNPIKPSGMVFPSSQNLLEDYLGVLVTSSMSYYFGVWYNMPYSIQYTVYADRIGTGSPWAILYILPTLLAGVLIAWLCIARQK